MPDFMKQRGADFRTEDRRVFLREIPEIFQPKPDARCRRFRCSLVKKPQRVGLNTVGDILDVGPPLEEDGHPLHHGANFNRKPPERGMNLPLRHF